MNLYTLVQQVVEGSLEVKLLTMWTDGKAKVGRVRGEGTGREKIRGERVRRKMQVHEKIRKGRKVAKHRETLCFC